MPWSWNKNRTNGDPKLSHKLVDGDEHWQMHSDIWAELLNRWGYKWFRRPHVYWELCDLGLARLLGLWKAPNFETRVLRRGYHSLTLEDPQYREGACSEQRINRRQLDPAFSDFVGKKLLWAWRQEGIPLKIDHLKSRSCAPSQVLSWSKDSEPSKVGLRLAWSTFRHGRCVCFGDLDLFGLLVLIFGACFQPFSDQTSLPCQNYKHRNFQPEVLPEARLQALRDAKVPQQRDNVICLRQEFEGPSSLGQQVHENFQQAKHYFVLQQPLQLFCHKIQIS